MTPVHGYNLFPLGRPVPPTSQMTPKLGHIFLPRRAFFAMSRAVRESTWENDQVFIEPLDALDPSMDPNKMAVE